MQNARNSCETSIEKSSQHGLLLFALSQWRLHSCRNSSGVGAVLGGSERVSYTYTYDDAGHLVSSQNGVGASLAYSYDPAGNLATLTYLLWLLADSLQPGQVCSSYSCSCESIPKLR